MSIKLKTNDDDTKPSVLSFIFVYIILKVLQQLLEVLYLLTLNENSTGPLGSGVPLSWVCASIRVSQH